MGRLGDAKLLGVVSMGRLGDANLLGVVSMGRLGDANLLGVVSMGRLGEAHLLAVVSMGRLGDANLFGVVSMGRLGDAAPLSLPVADALNSLTTAASSAHVLLTSLGGYDTASCSHTYIRTCGLVNVKAVKTFVVVL